MTLLTGNCWRTLKYSDRILRSQKTTDRRLLFDDILHHPIQENFWTTYHGISGCNVTAKRYNCDLKRQWNRIFTTSIVHFHHPSIAWTVNSPESQSEWPTPWPLSLRPSRLPWRASEDAWCDRIVDTANHVTWENVGDRYTWKYRVRISTCETSGIIPDAPQYWLGGSQKWWHHTT